MAAASTVVRLGRWAGVQPAAAREARLRLLIASGGDDRIWLDPVTRRNRYGVPASAGAGRALVLVVDRRADLAARLDGGRRGAGPPDRARPPHHRRLLRYPAPPAARALRRAGRRGGSGGLWHRGRAGRAVPRAQPGRRAAGQHRGRAGRNRLGRAGRRRQASTSSAAPRLAGRWPRPRRLAGWEDAQVALETIEIRLPCGDACAARPTSTRKPR